MKFIWLIIGAIIISSITVSGIYENTPETISTTVADPTERIITPVTFQAEYQSSQITSSSFRGSSQIDSVSDNSIPSLIQKADAVTSTEETLDVIKYQMNGEQSSTIDESKNMFSGDNNKVSRLDFATNIQTTWTLPNDQVIVSRFADVDSSGFYYFGMRSNTEYKLAKLDHTTNIFTEWILPVEVSAVKIDSSDNIYVLSGQSKESGERVFLRKLNTDTNTLTKYILPDGVSSFPYYQHFTMDNSGIFHFISNSESDIFKFNINTNSITLWENPSTGVSLNGIGVNSDGKIYFGESFQFRQKIAELDPATNVLKEWQIPLSKGVEIIAIDDEDKIFYGNTFTRFIPSTNTFTQWNQLAGTELLEILSDGTIVMANGPQFQFISSHIPPTPTVGTVVPAAGSGAPGCEETTNGCYIPKTASINVGDSILFSNTDSSAHTFTSGTSGGGPSGVFDSGLVLAGSSYEWTATTVGEFPYYCMVHPWMTGQIIVN